MLPFFLSHALYELSQSKKAEDELEDALREHKTKSSEQEKQIEELTRKVSQLEREKETLEGGLKYLAVTCHVIIT